MSPAELARHYYRMGLGAAKRRDLSAASTYAGFACLLDPEHGGASRLAEICRDELEGAEETPEEFERIGLLAGQKKWKAAALAAKRVPYQSVRILNIRGCLLALTKRYASATDCFARALAKDRGNVLAVEALACLGRRRNYLWRFFCSSLTR
jgi:tetratricopeptide (TPR) repeat protein